MKTPEQASNELGVKPETVRRWIRDESVPAIKIGRLWRISDKTLEEIASGKIQIKRKE